MYLITSKYIIIENVFHSKLGYLSSLNFEAKNGRLMMCPFFRGGINAILDIHNATVIAIAHRLSTIKHMDRIIVIDDGNIVEDGSFLELAMKDSGKFKKMWDSQVNGMIL